MLVLIEPEDLNASNAEDQCSFVPTRGKKMIAMVTASLESATGTGLFLLLLTHSVIQKRIVANAPKVHTRPATVTISCIFRDGLPITESLPIPDASASSCFDLRDQRQVNLQSVSKFLRDCSCFQPSDRAENAKNRAGLDERQPSDLPVVDCLAAPPANHG
jgi:hypothetical protein